MENRKYFIVCDMIGRSRKWRKYHLMKGDPETATGFFEHEADTIKSLLRKVPASETVYRVYLQRTDGKTGMEVIRSPEMPYKA